MITDDIKNQIGPIWDSFWSALAFLRAHDMLFDQLIGVLDDVRKTAIAA
jgi:hypothetical protein